MVDAVGTTRYNYDLAGQLLSEDGPWDSDTVSYTYSNRLRTGLALLAISCSPWTQTYAYDAARRLTSLSSPAGTFGYAYDSVRTALPGRLSLPNGAYITNTFDPLARLVSTSLKNSTNGILNSHAYGYDLASRRAALTNTFGDYRQFTYDSISQLTAASARESGGAPRWHEQFGYAYDAAGNLNSRTNNELVQTFGVNSLNELTTVSRNTNMTVAGTTTSTATNVTVNSVTALLYADSTFARTNVALLDGTNVFTAIARDALGRSDTNSATDYLPSTASFTYDLNGNLLSDGTRNFAYDDENQLTTVWVTNSWRSDFVYDGRMRRRIRMESTWGGSSWITNQAVRYVYDGELPIQERDGNNLPLTTLTRQGQRLLARTDHALLTFQNVSAHAYFHPDGRGDITALISGGQGVVARYLYDPFGRTLSCSGPLAEVNRYGFGSAETHSKSGLVYFSRRFYDPVLQSWLNRDPAQEAGGMNLYGFVGNNPLNAVDPSGLGVSSLDTPEGAGVMAWLAEQATVGAQWGLASGALSEEAKQFRAFLGGDCNALNPDAILDESARNAVLGAWTGPLFGAALEALSPVVRSAFGAVRAAAAKAAAQFAAEEVGAARTAAVEYANWGGEFIADMPYSAAAEGATTLADEIGILRQAARGTGNYGLGSATSADAMRLGKAWVGDGYIVASDGKTLLSADKLRQFRPPSPKSSSFATTGVQANFERRAIPSGPFGGNGHLNIIP
jgi:RHS repeat-associated protein